MFGFDGDYRRRPVQSLGGASQSCDRDTIIKKAQQERQKRNELRRQNNGAVVLQSYTRSFIHRQRCKKLEREAFDEFFRSHRDKVTEDDNLQYLLRGLLFFYNTKDSTDGQRLIDVCQQILRNPGRLLKNSTAQYIWLHRVRKLLDLCVTQLSIPQAVQAIPLRLLETFTTPSAIERFVEDENLVRAYLENVFRYLVRRNYFVRLRQLLDEKCPPLDGETANAPNPLTDAIFQLLLRPLTVLAEVSGGDAATIYESFVEHILSRPYTEPIRYYVLPALAAAREFPYQLLLRLFAAWTDQRLEAIRRQNEETNRSTFTGASSTQSAGASSLARKDLDQKKEADATAAAVAPSSAAKRGDQDEKAMMHDSVITAYLMYSLLYLNRSRPETVNSPAILGDYIKVLAVISPYILQLPKSSLPSSVVVHREHSDSDDSSDDEDDEDNQLNTSHKYSMQTDTFLLTTRQDFLAAGGGAGGTGSLNTDEKSILMECIHLLNDPAQVQVICRYLSDSVSGGDEAVLNGLCEICHNLMIYNKFAIFEYNLLYTLAFMPSFLRSVWFSLAKQSSQLGFQAPITLISKGVVPKQPGVERTIPLLATFCTLFGRLLPTLHDGEFCEDKLLSLDEKIVPYKESAHMPFSIGEIVQLSKTLKDISMGLVELAFPETRSSFNSHYREVLGGSDMDDKKMKQLKQIWTNLLKVVVFVLNQIHARDLRLGFCPPGHWEVSRLDLPLDRPTDLPLTRGSRSRGVRPFQPIVDFTRDDLDKGPPMSTKQLRSITILKEIPFVVAFSKRVGILQGLVAADKMRVQGNLQAFLQGPSLLLVVRRTHLYEDAYDKLRPENEPNLRLKFRVQFVSALGLDEAGIDGGGVFREFLSELIKTAFDPNRGFFMVTTDNKMYPNPNVGDILPDFEKHYYFIGRILGKAIYENLLVELPLADFFLTKLAGKYADVDIHQLASLDPELYKNLMYLKDYQGDVSELNLDFTVATNSLGQTQVVELKRGGASIPVTAANRIEYLQLMADYKLNVQIRKHCIAFRQGLSNVLPVEWLYMFSNKELQILISGAEIPIDLEDLKKHCKYGGEYGPEHPAIEVFWSVVSDFDDLQRRQLLKFVTSCSRPPLLGFKDLDPPFFIQNAGDLERLPTASTCTNLLKLPPLKTKQLMREKLLYAIQSGVGFELS